MTGFQAPFTHFVCLIIAFLAISERVFIWGDVERFLICVCVYVLFEGRTPFSGLFLEKPALFPCTGGFKGRLGFSICGFELES